MIWIYTFCQGKAYLGSAGQGLTPNVVTPYFFFTSFMLYTDFQGGSSVADLLYASVVSYVAFVVFICSSSLLILVPREGCVL